MPTLGADMDEGTLVEWRVKPGDHIRKGEIIAVVDTAKSAIEVESFHTGVIDTLVADVGQTVPVGAVLATITEGGPVPAATAGEAAGHEPGPPAGAHPVSPLVRRVAGQLGVDLVAVRGSGHGGAITRADVERAASAGRAGPASAAAQRRAAAASRGARGVGQAGHLVPATRRPVSPLARRLAGELGMDLASVTGTGPGGVVRGEDVRRAAHDHAGPTAPAAKRRRAIAPPTEPTQAPTPPQTGIAEEGAAAAQRRAAPRRQAIARLMARSKREIPHYYLSNTIDMGTAMTWLRERNRSLPMSGRLVPAALPLKATALAARQIPEVNGYWHGEAFEAAPAVHLAVATSLRGGGLVTPAIHDADRLPLGDLMASLRDLVARARAGRLRRLELTDATITVTNLGDQGVESVTGVIYPPQVALAGFGKVVERPWTASGLLGVRPVVVSTLAADHRATDGYTGARFLAAIDELLQRPEDL